MKASTYKAGLQWAPVSDIRFRGSFQRAIRAPNIIELFLPASVTNTSDVSEDPCAPTPAGPATATFQQCARTGVTAQQYGNGGSTNLIPQCPSGQCATLNVGNPNLRAERANTFSVGFTLRPGPPNRRLRVRARGFTTGKTLYAHVRKGRYRRNIKLGRLRGACRTLSVRKRFFGRRPPTGRYLVQFDTRRRFSRKTKVGLRTYVRVYRRVRFNSASASASRVEPLTP